MKNVEDKRYDIFYKILGDTATATLRGKNVKEAKRRFKKYMAIIQ